MSRFQVVQRAGEHERYTQTTFEGSVGKVVPLKVEGRRVGEAKLISAEVADDGKSVRLTFDATGMGNLLDPSDSSGYSFGFNARPKHGQPDTTLVDTGNFFVRAPKADWEEA